MNPEENAGNGRCEGGHGTAPGRGKGPAGEGVKSFLKGVFRRAGRGPSRKLGQNFLLDPNLLEFIAKSAGIGPDDVVLEVGTGAGQLTALLARCARGVVGVEVDGLLFETTSAALAGFENVRLMHGDALSRKSELNPGVSEAVRETMGGGPGELLLVSNLSYAIATPLIVTLLESDLPFSRMTVMVQNEAAEKLAARGPEDPGYGPVSLLVSRFAEVRTIRRVPPEVFWPRPRVESAIVQLEVKKKSPSEVPGYGTFRKLVRTIFTQRRKKAVKGLSESGLAARETARGIFEAAGVDPDSRPEELRPADFEKLAAQILAAGGNASGIP